MYTTEPPSTPALEPWVSKKTIAAHYEAGIRTVERWTLAGCPSRLIGGVRRYQLSDVDAWLRGREEMS